MKNPKSESRNPKQIRITAMTESTPLFAASDFGFVSSFGFRISDLSP